MKFWRFLTDPNSLTHSHTKRKNRKELQVKAGSGAADEEEEESRAEVGSQRVASLVAQKARWVYECLVG